MEIVQTQSSNSVQIAPAGALNSVDAVDALRGGLKDAIKLGHRQLVIDFSSVPVVNSAALEALLNTQESLIRDGGVLEVLGANATIQDVLRLTGLEHLIGGGNRARLRPAYVSAAARHAGKRLGDLLVERELATSETIDKAIGLQQDSGQRLGQILVGQGWLRESDLLLTLSVQLNIPFVRLRAGLYDPQVVRLLPHSLARRHKVLPLFRIRDQVYLALNDPQDVAAIDAVEQAMDCRIRPVLATGADIQENVGEALNDQSQLTEYIGELDVDADLEVVEEQAEDFTRIDQIAAGSPVINLINALVQRAVRDGASDIHIEPARTRCRVRFRIDGVLYPVMTPPRELLPSLVSRLKVMANLDIAEHRLPQDGRIQVYTQGRTIDLRFSSLPGIYGEKVVLRVLDKASTVMEIDHLGMHKDVLTGFKRLLGHSHGLLLVTGPTGSGKTTSLYAAINYLNSIEKSIVTIEDPVEYQMDVINQNQVREGIGLDFPTVLKHVLRQDPDIIMVGEIRENVTAEIGVQAALTGHLVLSTLHTNDSIGAITRLLDMGVAPYLLSSAMIGVLSQRLVRRICKQCATAYTASAESLAELGLADATQTRLFRGHGCPECYDSGYKGRLALHELLVVDADAQRLMATNPTRDQLTDYTRSHGLKTLYDAGLEQALAGHTTIEEVLRVVQS